MAKVRNYAKERAQRDAKARSEGYTSYGQKRYQQAKLKKAASSVAKDLPTPPHTTRVEESAELAFPVEYPSSTRCQAFKYVPYADSPGIGAIYMRFIKYGTAWVYRDVPEGVYFAFASAPSKGRAVNTMLNSYSAGNPTWDEQERFFQDM